MRACQCRHSVVLHRPADTMRHARGGSRYTPVSDASPALLDAIGRLLALFCRRYRIVGVPPSRDALALREAAVLPSISRPAGGRDLARLTLAGGAVYGQR